MTRALAIFHIFKLNPHALSRIVATILALLDHIPYHTDIDLKHLSYIGWLNPYGPVREDLNSKLVWVRCWHCKDRRQQGVYSSEAGSQI